MEDSGFCYRANERRLLVRFPCIAATSSSARRTSASKRLEPPKNREPIPKTCPQESHLKTVLSARGRIGGDLVRTALGIADELNEPLFLVLGFPAYYRRFGFQRASAFGIAPPDGIPDDAWMPVTLSSYSPALRGKVIWPPAFSGVT